MEVSQVKKKRQEICDQIADRIRQFEEETGTRITYVSLIRSETLGIDYRDLADVEVHIELW